MYVICNVDCPGPGNGNLWLFHVVFVVKIYFAAKNYALLCSRVFSHTLYNLPDVLYC